MHRDILFGQVEASWQTLLLAALQLATVVFVWRTKKSSVEENRTMIAGQTAAIELHVTHQIAPLNMKADTIVQQTNGITERLEAKSAALSESNAVLSVTTEKLKQYDPNATVVKVAEGVIAKAQSATPLPSSSPPPPGSPPTPPPPPGSPPTLPRYLRS